MRSKYKKGNLEEEEIQKLEQAGMVWNVGGYRWEAYYKAAVEYKKRFGDLEIPCSYVTEGGKNIVVLHCVLSYPTEPEDANLRVITALKEGFPDIRIGYSDHVVPDDTMMTLTAACLLGAEVIEKHFTLDKTLQGNDHYHAASPEDFKRAIANFNWLGRVLGNPQKTVLDCEIIPRREARRSLVLTHGMKAGEVIMEKDLAAKRPGTGISPKDADIVIGRNIKMDLEGDTVLTWDMV